MKKNIFFLLAFPYMAFAQNALPDTEIFICDVELKNGKYSFTNLENITNRVGYDNQPFFLNNDTILYTSIREDKQADIYIYSLKTNKIVQLTNTPEDEYSPTLMPGGKHISTVRVEKDSTQRLWKFPLKNPNNFSLVLPDVKGVGYHTYLSFNNVLGLFILGKSFTLKIAEEQNITTIDSNIGRSMYGFVDPNEGGGNNLFYVSKEDSSNWIIKHYSDGHYGTEIKKIISLPKNSEDFVVSNGIFWIGSEGKLFRFDAGKDKDWIEVYDFKGTPAENFYRIAFSADGKKLALVAYKGKKP